MTESQEKNGLQTWHTLVLPALLALIVGSYVPEAVGGSLIGMVKIEDCEVSESGLDCEKKAVVTIPVSYGMETNMEALSVKQISKDGEPQTIEETFTISITKSQPRVMYPLRYLHTVSYFPHEEVIKVPDTLGCIDCASAASPTAGWTYQGSFKIEHSQGFCLSKLFAGSDSSCFWRGEEILGEKATLENPFSTAHAMRTGELFFDGYEIGEYAKDYEVVIEVVKGDDVHAFLVSPSDPLYSCRDDEDYDGNLKMKAELIGDMAEYKGTPELDNYILYIPASPDSHPFVQDYQNNMLLVPREEVSKDGGELDKVGVSFYTFRKLMGSGNARVTEAGDGLHNQLFHKHNSDLQKLITNPDAETSYLVHGKKDFKGSMTFEAGMKKFLEYRIPEISYSMISLTVDLESIKVIKTESIGAIIEAYVKKFDSMSENGTLFVKIGNFSDLTSDYITTVTNANMNIMPAMPAQSRTIEPYEEADLEFDVSTVYEPNSTHEFLVTLKSTTGRVYDKTTVIFDTEIYETRYPWDLQEKNEASQSGTPHAVADDETPPVIRLNSPDDAVVLFVGESYVDPNATATDNADGIVPVVIGGDEVDTSVAGIYVVRYDATDKAGNEAKQLTRMVIVREALGSQDTTPPQLVLSATPTTLWPANHKMVKVSVTMIASDETDPSPVVSLVGVTLSEGTYADDVEIHNDGLIYLRAETLSSESSREYTITYRATDAGGNSIDKSVTIIVPHDKSQL